MKLVRNGRRKYNFILPLAFSIGLTLAPAIFINGQQVSARCPNGSHMSPSGDCEPILSTGGLPRCPNGYQRSPSGGCESVSVGDNSLFTQSNIPSPPRSSSSSTLQTQQYAPPISSLPYDTSPPDTFIISSTDGNNSTVQNGGTTTSNKITFTFAGVDNLAISGFVCILDNRANGPFSCSLTVIINNLSVGDHTFDVSAVDASGNRDNTPIRFTWSVTSSTANS